MYAIVVHCVPIFCSFSIALVETIKNGLREVGEKVVVQDDGDAVQQGGVDGGAAKNAVDVASATV